MKILLCLLALACATLAEERKPTLWLIGDSTVKNGTPGLVGWGERLAGHFDSARLRVENRALGGRSSRSYLREGLWDKVLGEVQPGDFVIMQFGHNDAGPLEDVKARASLKGNGEETKEVTLKETGATETVHSYGWYLRHYAETAKAKGATPLICSLVPRNIWHEGKVARSGDYAVWAREVAGQTGAAFLDLNQRIAGEYDALGEEKVRELFTPADHTHTNDAGARRNAAAVAAELRALPEHPLAKYLLPEAAP